jgi:uncharacterized membrane protein
MRSFFTLLFLLVSFCVTSAQVIFRNEGTSRIYVAYGYRDISSGWTTKGWYTVEPGEEKPVYNYTILSNPNFYYCATIDKCDQGYFGQYPLYVNSQQPFTISNADKIINYANTLIKPYKFNLVSLAGKSSYTITFKPENLKCGGLAQGRWRLALDRYGDYAEKDEDKVFYREIVFESGKPIGWCKDFYANGKLKAEFKLLSAKPVIYNGHCTWYMEDGNKEREADYENGTLVSKTDYSGGETKVSKARLEVLKLPLQSFYLNSTSNESIKGGSTRTVYSVVLPKGTVEWFYEFTASRNKEEIDGNTKLFSLAGQLTKVIDETGVLSAGIGMFTAPPGGDVCNVYLLDDSYAAFRSKQKFTFWSAGSRTNFKSGIVEIRGNDLRNPMIGIDNPDLAYGIHVNIQVVAVVSKLE